jgi:hypothetical protein
MQIPRPGEPYQVFVCVCVCVSLSVIKFNNKPLHTRLVGRKRSGQERGQAKKEVRLRKKEIKNY